MRNVRQRIKNHWFFFPPSVTQLKSAVVLFKERLLNLAAVIYIKVIYNLCCGVPGYRVLQTMSVMDSEILLCTYRYWVSFIYNRISKLLTSSFSFDEPSREAAERKQTLQTVNQRVVWTKSTLVNNAFKYILKERQSPMFIWSSSVFI